MSNKLYSEESIQAIANSIRAKNGTSETYTISEMSTAISALPTNLTTKTITANGTYNASSDDADGYSSVTVNVEGYAKKSIQNTPTAIATFNASALPMPSLTVGIEAVQAGNGDPSPTNVRHISGWSAVNVPRTGKNIFNIDAEHTSETGVYTYTYVIKAKPNTNYTMSTNAPQTSPASLYFNGGNTNVNGVWDGTPRTFTSDENGKLTTFVRFNISQGGIDLYTAVKNGTYYIQLEEGSFDTEYEPFGTTYTTALKDGQGNPMTCHGGQLTNENGVQSLDNRMGIVDLGTLNWSKYGDDRFYTSISDIKMPETSADRNKGMMCSIYKPSPDLSVGEMADYSYLKFNQAESFWVRDSRYSDATAFKTAMSGVYLIYELATPQQIPQDNLAIATQEGTNNLWADSGDIQSGEYLEAL